MLGLFFTMRHLSTLIGAVMFARSCGIKVCSTIRAGLSQHHDAIGTCQHLPVDLIRRHAEACSMYAKQA